MLKSRFGALKKYMDINLHDLPTVIHTCFIHNHNYCEMNKEYVANDLVKKIMEYEREFQPNKDANARNLAGCEAIGKQTRNMFVKYFDG